MFFVSQRRPRLKLKGLKHVDGITDCMVIFLLGITTDSFVLKFRASVQTNIVVA